LDIHHTIKYQYEKLEAVMKYQKLSILIVLVVLLLSTVQIGSTWADEGHKIFLPMIKTSLPTPSTPSTPSIFGMQTHDYGLLGIAAEANNYWIRHNALYWSKYQPDGPGQFVRGSYATYIEGIMKDTSEAGMEMILIVRSTPEWAQKYPGYYCGPMAQQYISDFADFMHQVVETYSAPPYNVKYYEIWNEPDAIRDPNFKEQVFGCWGEPGDPYFGGEYFGEMLAKVYPAIKAANPNAQVILGGLLMPCDPRQPGQPGYCPPASDPNFGNNVSEAKFFEGILEGSGGQAYFDYVNFHGFTFYEPIYPSAILMERNSNAWWFANGGLIDGKLNYLNSTMANYGIAKPAFVTEVSMTDYWESSVNNPGFDWNAYEATKADYVTWLYSRNMARGVAGTTWYHLGEHGWRWSGLLNENNVPLPAYEAFKVASNTLTGAEYQKDLSLGSGILGFEFSQGTQGIWVLFSEDGQPKTINTPVGFVKAYDLLNNPVLPSGGTIGFTRPIYIEVSP
jgi:hypothetical protein